MSPQEARRIYAAEAKAQGTTPEPPPSALTVPVTDTRAGLKDATKRYTGEALAVIVQILQSETTPPGLRMTAASEVLNRGWGKPGSEVSLSEETLAILAPVMVPRKNPVAVIDAEIVVSRP